MDQEKPVQFSIIKQKIIKTDEILRMYLETSNKLKKAQQVCKEFKLQYDQNVINSTRIQLEHERCTFSLENLKQQNEKLDKENRELREHTLVLEERYNRQSVQSQLNIKQLEDDLKMISEIKNTAENWSPKKRRSMMSENKINNDVDNKSLSRNKMQENVSVDAFKESNTVKKFPPEVNTMKERNTISNEIISEMATEEHLNTIIDDNTDSEPTTFKCPQSQEKCHKFTKAIGTQTHKVGSRNVHTQTIETLKTLQLHNTVFAENKQLKLRMLEYEAEVIKLKAKCNPLKMNSSTQTEDIEVDDEFVEYILKEMSVPQILSPLSPDTDISLNTKRKLSPVPENTNNLASDPSTMPGIISFPNPVTDKHLEMDVDSVKEQEFRANVKNNLMIPLANNKEYTENIKTFARRKKYNLNNEFVKLRKSVLRKLVNKRYIFNSEMKKLRKRHREDYVLKTLCALKHCKINFTISSDPILPKCCNNTTNADYAQRRYTEKDRSSHFAKYETYLTEQLNCLCKKCKPSNMLLSNKNDETYLLGFYNVKNEVNTPVSSRMDNVQDIQSFNTSDTTNLINSFSNNNKITCENVLYKPAKTVNVALHRNKNKTSKRKRMMSKQFDTFDSETESEIERLFEKPEDKPNNDILKRNKMSLDGIDSGTLNIPVSKKIEYKNKENIIKQTEEYTSVSIIYKKDISNDDFKFPISPLSPVNSIDGQETFNNMGNLLDCQQDTLLDSEEISSHAITYCSNKTTCKNPREANMPCNSTHDQFNILDNFKSKSTDHSSIVSQIVSPIKTKQQKISDIFQHDEDSICVLPNYSEIHVVDENEDVPNHPESPIFDNVNEEIKPPILIPLEKLNIQGNEKKYKDEQDNNRISSGIMMSASKNKELTSSSPRSLRRSQRILQKNSNVTLSDLNQCVKKKSSQSHIDYINLNNETQLSCESTVTPSPAREISNNVTNTDLIQTDTENGTSTHTLEQCNGDKETPIIKSGVRKRKRIGVLQSKVLRQMKLKKQMFRTKVPINILKINDCEPIIQNDCVTDNNKGDNKIHIVQNILIPPNSNSIVDLMKGNILKTKDVEKNCDIRLDKGHPSQSSSSHNSSADKKIDHNTCNNIPKKKIKTCSTADCDLLSKIIGEMDKVGPKIIPKNKAKSIDSKELVPDSTDKKQWRKGVLVIADNIYNIQPRKLTEDITNKYKIFNPKSKLTLKRRFLIKKLKLCSEDKLPDEIVLEFKREDVHNIVEMILHTVSQDVVDKPDIKYYPAPLMTKTQRTLLGLMVRLEHENVEKVMDTFLSKTETFLFKVGCNIRMLIPIIRLYMAVCKLRRDIDKMRNFCCNAFLFMGDLAVPMLFTVLTSWIEVFPMESCVNSFPLAKILIQIIHLKNCSNPGYNLLPLKFLLSQYYGYPKERWNCDEIFEEVSQQYLKNPEKSVDLAIQLLCRNKETKWVYKKINEFFKPLVYKIPLANVNFKATVIILIGKICKHFKPKIEFDEVCLNELRRWLVGLTEDQDTPELISKSVDISLSKLPKKKIVKKKTTVTCPKKIITRQQKRNRKKCKKKKPKL